MKWSISNKRETGLSADKVSKVIMKHYKDRGGTNTSTFNFDR